jgi:hypothetical protein
MSGGFRLRAAHVTEQYSRSRRQGEQLLLEKLRASLCSMLGGDSKGGHMQWADLVNSFGFR